MATIIRAKTGPEVAWSILGLTESSDGDILCQKISSHRLCAACCRGLEHHAPIMPIFNYGSLQSGAHAWHARAHNGEL
eukprot:CAMPEP_0119104506 /NCGR_PEP_ID=MMETSP1180-20130426/2703_1 /TAXON_ID=3052 ORGANISM="Chlamydomonas cf sp, Strain CCMP681" /NCGR_SAMPLE_ID=MMETSP1180 /ASSEMBLY_ACC=CAM_ASM_000741 /LENGTH=77 /DNA_ID=CAMNT_0007089287 /DNA_START=855 /DNA_END=1088 /DNA_ORIENTATION=+